MMQCSSMQAAWQLTAAGAVMQQAEDAEAAPPGAVPERAPDLASVLEGLEDPDAAAAGEEAAQQLGDGAEEPLLALPPPEAGARSPHLDPLVHQKMW